MSIFRDAEIGERFSDYMEEMWCCIIRNKLKELIGKHNHMKITLEDIDEDE